MSAPYTYPGSGATNGEGYHSHPPQSTGDNSFGAGQEASLPYPPMPQGYQQFQAPPLPTPGHSGYVAGPQYDAPNEYAALQALIDNSTSSPRPPGYQYQPKDGTSVPIVQQQPGDNSHVPPSVFDVDPSTIKRTAYFVPINKQPAGAEGDLNIAANAPGGNNEYPVIGHVLTLPFSAEYPTMGVAIDSTCCRYCYLQEYRGRTLDYSKKHHSSINLTIVQPTAAMSYQDGVSQQFGCIDGELFRPCLCPSFIHRGCFREMRSGLSVLKSRDYYECPHCRFTYKLERIMGGARPDKKRSGGSGALSGPTAGVAMGAAEPCDEREYTWLEQLSEGNVRTRFYIKIALMWAVAIAIMGAVIGILAGASYGLDRNEKRIPVFIKMMLSSLAATYPSSEKRDQWRAEFLRPDIAVWQYYLAFAIFLSAVLLIAFGLISYLACVDTNDSEIRPSLCGYFCEGDADREREINHYIRTRQSNQREYLTSLPAPVHAAVVQREERRSNEIRDHYYRQRKPSYWFSCSDNSSYYYYDSRPYYYRRRKNYYDNRYNGHGRHYYSGGYYAGGDSACCDLCLCCTVWCCSPSSSSSLSPYHRQGSERLQPNSGGSSSTDCCSNCNCNGCYCGDCGGCGDCGDCNCNCGSSDCNCNGGDGEGAAAVLVVLLVVILVIAIIVILSAYVTLVCYLISRTVRLMGVAGKLAYVQALEEEDHVFCLAINESWRPVGAV